MRAKSLASHSIAPFTVKIRLEQPADSPAIAQVGTASFGRSSEAQLIDRIRSSDRAWFSYVAEQEGAIVGHILLSAVDLVGESRHSVWALALIAVHPDAQRRGVGTALIQTAVQQAAETNFPFVVVLGHPEFYARCGFEPASDFGIRAPFDVPSAAFRIKRLPAFDFQQGAIEYPVAFAGL